MSGFVGDRWGKTEGYCSTGQSPQWAVVPMEEEEECLVSINARIYTKSHSSSIFKTICFLM